MFAAEYPKVQYLSQNFFTIYINNIDTNLQCKVSKIANDTKLGYTCKTIEEYSIIQQDLNLNIRIVNKIAIVFLR